MNTKIDRLSRNSPYLLCKLVKFNFEVEGLLNKEYTDREFIYKLLSLIIEDLNCIKVIVYIGSKKRFRRLRMEKINNKLEFKVLSDISRNVAPKSFYCLKPDSDLKEIVFDFKQDKTLTGQIKFVKKEELTTDEIVFFDLISNQISEILKSHFTELALKERVKELGGIYKMTEIASIPDISITEILTKVVDILPPAWQYPDITAGFIKFDNIEAKTKNYLNPISELSATIKIKEKVRGEIKVAYLKEMSEIDEGPFLKEERDLINSLAKQLSIVLERKEEEIEKENMKKQLRHADRLATIGQLSSGIAHELNEPLASILGFAQLIKKNEGLSENIISDLSKIEKTSLYAREIVRKLLIFARQTKSKMNNCNINEIILASIEIVESRLYKENVKLKLDLEDDIKEIFADRFEIQQVILNLIINGMQAMKNGGVIKIKSYNNDKSVFLEVEDTGSGMDKNTLNKIFMPFFTTKEVNEGTGLGLAVVHGIVTSHKGEIKVKSKINEGTKFTIKFPVSVMD